MEQNKNAIVWFLIVVIFIGLLIFLVKDKGDGYDTSQLGLAGGSDMVQENTNEIEGIGVEVLQIGEGEVASSGTTVSMNYTGMLPDGSVFDSNVDSKFMHVEPFVFTIGESAVIKGWHLGIDGMRVGEKRRLTIAPELAYG